jgi:hypothetical protein
MEPHTHTHTHAKWMRRYISVPENSEEMQLEDSKCASKILRRLVIDAPSQNPLAKDSQDRLQTNASSST